MRINKAEVDEKARIKLGKLIDDLRNRKNLGFNQLAMKSGVNVRSLNEILNGNSKKINPFFLQNIANALGIDYREFYKIVGYLEEDNNSNIKIETEYRSIPLFSNICAGSGGAEADIVDYLAVPAINNFRGDVFAVKVDGDSMEHTIEDKSIVFIKKDVEVQNNKIGAFILNNESYLKRLCKMGEKIFLRSDNRDYPDIPVEPSDNFVVVGRYIGTIMNTDE